MWNLCHPIEYVAVPGWKYWNHFADPVISVQRPKFTFCLTQKNMIKNPHEYDTRYIGSYDSVIRVNNTIIGPIGHLVYFGQY